VNGRIIAQALCYTFIIERTAMKLAQRLGILGILAAMFLAAYGLGRLYSAALVAYIVEHALIEKSPAGTDPESIRKRLAARAPDSAGSEERLRRLLAISQRLEKVQKLAPVELDEILGQ